MRPCLRGEPRTLSNWILIVLVLVAFGRLFTSDFSWWDDQGTIHHNGWYNPPTLDTLRHYWTTPELGLFVPITSTVWAVLAKLAYVNEPDDYGIKLNPMVFHGTSVLLHVASALIVLRILRRLLANETAALLGAMLFAFHPVQVETVGWVSGMKDLLCWVFALGSLLLYLRRVQTVAAGQSSWRGIDLPVAFFLMVLAILSKPTAMVLPAAMATLDLLIVRRHWKRVLLTLLPFLALTIAGAILARDAQFVQHVKAAPLWQRPFIVGDTLAFYVRKLFWPATLTIDYGRKPEIAMASPLAYVWWVVPAGIGVAGLLAARRGIVLPLAGLLVAVIGVAPVSGIATFQMQSYSTVTDHYLYFSMLGVAILFAGAIARWPAKSIRVAAFVILATLGVRTWFQTAIWHDSFALFSHAMWANEKSSLAVNNLAAVYLAKTPEDLAMAEKCIDIAYARAPHDFFVLSNYGNIKARVGQPQLAYPAWEECLAFIKKTPRQEAFRATFCADVAGVLLNIGELDQAQRWIDEAMAADSNAPHVADVAFHLRKAVEDRATTRAASQPSTSP